MGAGLGAATRLPEGQRLKVTGAGYRQRQGLTF